MHDFEDIRPYHDEEVRGVVDALLDDLDLSRAMGKFKHPQLYKWFPGPVARLTQSTLKNELRHVNCIRDVQDIIEKYLDKIIETTTDGLTHTGLDRLDPSVPWLFLSNHRDITMDPALVNYMLYHNEFDTLQIAIGDNLLKRPFLTHLMKLNKSFIVKRSVQGRDKLAASKQLSAYIRHCIHTGQNVWIAQREGRAKNGIDETETAVLKMLHLAGRDAGLALHDAIDELHIVPVSISYEFDPCDGAKAAELHERDMTGTFVKDENTDVNSILTGMVGYKGAVHVSFGTPVRAPAGATEKSVAEQIDAQILGNYKLHLVNYLALQKLQPAYMDFATLPALFGTTPALVQQKLAEFDGRLQAMPAALHPYVLAMYANPVLQKARVGALA
ncbi:MAG: 1-acyl-sn-glycerol-3-phosphate acyltransferase [Gammaproteobacteria bacterium]